MPSVPALVREQGEAHPHPGPASVPEEQRIHRPAERGHHPHRDEGVHRRRAMARAGQRRPVERPGSPYRYRRGQRQRQPLPVAELQHRRHRQHDHRDGQRQRDQQPLPQRGRLISCRLLHRAPRRRSGRRRRRQRRGVPGLRHDRDQVIGADRGGETDPGLLRGEVHRGRDTVQPVQLLFDPRRARGAGHPADRQFHAADRPGRDLWPSYGARTQRNVPPARTR